MSQGKDKVDFIEDCSPGESLALHNYTAAALCLQRKDPSDGSIVRDGEGDSECMHLAAATKSL